MVERNCIPRGYIISLDERWNANLEYTSSYHIIFLEPTDGSNKDEVVIIESLQAIPLLPSATLSEEAERRIIEGLINHSFFKDPSIQRRIASYYRAKPAEKDRLVLELLDLLCETPYGNQLFCVLRDFDNIFRILGKKGHFIHQFEVFLLGLNIINRLLHLNSDNIRLFSLDSEEKIFLTWLLTATTHDIGYPLHMAKNIIAKFADLYRKMGMENLAIKYESIKKEHRLDQEGDLTIIKIKDSNRGRYNVFEIEPFLVEGMQASLNINKADAEKLQKTLRRTNNHGYVSSIILCHAYLEYTYKSKRSKSSRDEWRIDALRNAASAIALHALTPKLETYLRKISFELNPFAFLLTLVDKLQEWSRILGKNNALPSYQLIEFSYSANQIHFCYLLEHDMWTRAIEKKVKNYLMEKKRTLDLMVKPNLPLDFQVLIDFYTNHNYKYDQIIIQL